jgi:hypothetical protein
VVSRDGSALAAEFSITPAAAAAPASVDGGSAGVATITFTDTLQPRELWTLRINGGTSFSVSIGEIYEVNGKDVVANTWSNVALIFADRVSSGDLFAITEDSALVIVNRAGALTAEIRTTPAEENTDNLYNIANATDAWSTRLIGTPVTGETWIVSINTGSATNFSYVVLPDDNLSDVALALATLINNAPGTFGMEFTAMVEGDRLVVVRGTGGAFTLNLAVTPAAVAANANGSSNIALIFRSQWRSLPARRPPAKSGALRSVRTSSITPSLRATPQMMLPRASRRKSTIRLEITSPRQMAGCSSS